MVSGDKCQQEGHTAVRIFSEGFQEDVYSVQPVSGRCLDVRLPHPLNVTSLEDPFIGLLKMLSGLSNFPCAAIVDMHTLNALVTAFRRDRRAQVELISSRSGENSKYSSQESKLFLDELNNPISPGWYLSSSATLYHIVKTSQDAITIDLGDKSPVDYNHPDAVHFLKLRRLPAESPNGLVDVLTKELEKTKSEELERSKRSQTKSEKLEKSKTKLKRYIDCYSARR
jgi:hypothetical protein